MILKLPFEKDYSTVGVISISDCCWKKCQTSGQKGSVSVFEWVEIYEVIDRNGHQYFLAFPALCQKIIGSEQQAASAAWIMSFDEVSNICTMEDLLPLKTALWLSLAEVWWIFSGTRFFRFSRVWSSEPSLSGLGIIRKYYGVMGMGNLSDRWKDECKWKHNRWLRAASS